jgi:hypothetical protein
VTLALRKQCIPGLYLAPLYFQSPRQKLHKNSKKAPKSIDKIRIGFIIELWGKVGKKGDMRCDR